MGVFAGITGHWPAPFPDLLTEGLGPCGRFRLLLQFPSELPSLRESVQQLSWEPPPPLAEMCGGNLIPVRPVLQSYIKPPHLTSKPERSSAVDQKGVLLACAAFSSRHDGGSQMPVQDCTMQKPSLLTQAQISSTAHRGTVRQVANYA